MVANNELRPGSGFVFPEADFDPMDNQHILDLYKRKAEHGLLDTAEELDDSVADTVARKIAEYEKATGRKITEAESDQLIGNIIQLGEGSWLQGLKLQLVGKNTVRIEYFNRLVAEREKALEYIARRLAGEENRRREQQHSIKELRTENEKLHAENDQLREASKNPEAGEGHAQKGSEAQQDDPKSSDSSEKEIRELKDRIQHLRSDLSTCRQHRNQQHGEIEHLKQEASDSRARERTLKDQARQADQTAENLRKELELAKAGQNAPASAPNPAPDSTGSTGQGNTGHLTEQNAKLQARIKDLEDQVHTLRDFGTSPSSADPVQLNKELQVARAEIKRIRKELDHANHRFLQGAAINNNMAEFWEAIDRTRNAMGTLMQGIETLAQGLGFDKDIHAEDALKLMLRAVNDLPNDTRHLGLTALQLSGQLQTTKARLVDAEIRVQELQRPQRQKTEAELRAELRIVDEAEMEKRVQEAIRIYRLHRKDILDVIFNISNVLRQIANDTADEKTSAKILTAVAQHLAPENLPLPRPADAH
ncbi:hypothetical protein F5B20DRAFT_536566 [Whalleya microplaca]|nr:hypothetical protein F5B20DRAFT_536566 [Whalleya microplaca]